MNKLILSVFAVVSLLSAFCPLRAQTPLDYYKLGQFFDHVRWANNLTAYMKRSDLRAKLDVERRLLVQLNAPSAVMISYDHMVNSFADLPIDTSYASWTQGQRDNYTNSGLDYTAINTWLPVGDNVQRFYFWLGYQVEFMAKSGPLSVNSWGVALPDAAANYKNPLSDMAAFRNNFPVSMKTALPEIQAAIIALAAYNGKTLAKADIDVMQTQAMIIYNDANGKVTP